MRGLVPVTSLVPACIQRALAVLVHTLNKVLLFVSFASVSSSSQHSLHSRLSLSLVFSSILLSFCSISSLSSPSSTHFALFLLHLFLSFLFSAVSSLPPQVGDDDRIATVAVDYQELKQAGRIPPRWMQLYGAPECQNAGWVMPIVLCLLCFLLCNPFIVSYSLCDVCSSCGACDTTPRSSVASVPLSSIACWYIHPMRIPRIFYLLSILFLPFCTLALSVHRFLLSLVSLHSLFAIRSIASRMNRGAVTGSYYRGRALIEFLLEDHPVSDSTHMHSECDVSVSDHIIPIAIVASC